MPMPTRLLKYYLTYVAAPLNRRQRRRSVKKNIFIAKFDGLGDFFILCSTRLRSIAAFFKSWRALERLIRILKDPCGTTAK